MMYVIDAPHFYGGLIVEDPENPIITKAPPIMKWAIGKNIEEVLQYCVKKGYKIGFEP